MARLIRALALALVATVLLAGCSASKPQDKGAVPAKPPEVTYAGNIFAVSGSSLSVYVYEGYRGVVVVHVSDKTAIDAAMKSKLKAGNYIAFVTDGRLMESEPPQANALVVKSVVEGVLIRGRVTAVGEGQVTVETTAPRTETLVARTTDRTLITGGVDSRMAVGSLLEFEIAPVVQQSYPARAEIIRLLKNDTSRIVPAEVTRIAGRPVTAVLNRNQREVIVKTGAVIAMDLEEDASTGRWFWEVSREQVFRYVAQGTYLDAAAKTHRVIVLQPERVGEHYLYPGFNSKQNKVLERLTFQVLVEDAALANMREYTGSYLGLEDGFITLQTRTGVQTVWVANLDMVKELVRGDRLVVVASLGEAVQRLEIVRRLPAAEDVFGHFVRIQRILKENIEVVLLDAAAMSMMRDGVTLPAGLVAGSSAYVEYRVDKMAEMSILRTVEVVKW